MSSESIINGSDYNAFFQAAYALCVLAGTPLPVITRDPSWTIQKKACAAIVALQLSGIPTDAVVAALTVRVTAVEIAAAAAQATANAAQSDATDAYAAALLATTLANAAQVTATAAMAAAVAVGTFTAQNKDVTVISSGMVVAAHPSGTGVLKAYNSGVALSGVGIARANVSPTFSGVYQTDDTMALANWSAATGSVNLSPLGVYFLSLTPGMITTTPPTTVGRIVQIVGYALSPTTLRILINPAILL